MRCNRRAETLFVQGNSAQTFVILENVWQDTMRQRIGTFGCHFVILENVWQDTVNRDYPPLVTLRQQVGSRLGI